MAITDARTAIAFERVTGTVGAWVHGVKLGSAPEPATVERLRSALHDHGVLFFDFDHTLDKSEFREISALFGEPEGAYRLSPSEGAGQYIDSDRVPMNDVRINTWHSDGTCFECPPQAAILTPVELPEVGGDTMWASMYAAWEGLSSHYQRLLEDLDVLHSTARLPFLEQGLTAVHPAVIRDAVTDRKMLFVNTNYTERFLGLGERENEALLRMLFEHINTPEFHVRLRWQLGVVAVWEERVTQHRGVADFVGPRKLRRLTFSGDRPTR